MRYAFKIITKKPFREESEEVARILINYNNHILTKASEEFKKDGIKFISPNSNNIEVFCDSEKAAEELHKQVKTFINDIYSKVSKSLADKEVVNSNPYAFATLPYLVNEPSHSKHRLETTVGELPSFKLQRMDKKTTEEPKTQPLPNSKLTIFYKSNADITYFLEITGEMFPGIITFKTTDKPEGTTTHKIKFVDEEISLLYRNKLRKVDYTAKNFSFKDFEITDNKQEKVKIIYKDIKHALPKQQF